MKEFNYPKFYNLKIIIMLIVLFVFGCGVFDNNWFLNGKDIGLLEHPTIWLFFTFNCVFLKLLDFIKKLFENENQMLYQTIKESIKKIVLEEAFINIVNCLHTIGFIFFLYNSFQNAHPITNLGFSYWDSIDYSFSYMLSRVYKLYLFAFFYPESIGIIIAILYSCKKKISLNDSKSDRKIVFKFAFRCITIFICFNVLINFAIIYVHKKMDIVTFVITTLNIFIIVASYLYLTINLFIKLKKERESKISQLEEIKTEINKKIINNPYANDEAINYIKLYNHYDIVIQNIKAEKKIPFLSTVLSRIMISSIPILLNSAISLIKKAFLFLSNLT